MFNLANTDQTLGEVDAIKQRIERIELAADDLARGAAQRGANLVRDRVQLEGKDAAGERMLTSSPKRLGRYSESHGRVRQKEGLRTDIVNLTFSGELLNGDNWSVIHTGAREYGAGFRDNELSQRAIYLEDDFGTIFQLSPDEELNVVDYFNQSVEDLITTFQ